MSSVIIDQWTPILWNFVFRTRLCLYWQKQNTVTQNVKCFDVEKTPLPTMEIQYGADGLKKTAKLQIVAMQHAQKDAYCQRESVEKP